MKCRRCQVEILSGQRRCPLCHDVLTEAATENTAYPVYTLKKQRSAFYRRLLLFVSLAAILVCSLINILTGGRLWSIYVTASVLCFWLFIDFSAFQHSWLRATLRCTFAGALFVFVVDVLDGHLDWSSSWVLPAVFFSITLLLTVFIIAKPLRLHDFMFYLLTMAFFGLALVVGGIVGLFSPVLPAYIGAAYQLLTILALSVFSDRSMGSELKKRLHI